MAASGDEQRKTERWRAADLEEAGRLGADFGLGTVTGVIRQWSDRSGLIGCADVLLGGALVWGIGGTLFFVLPAGPGWDKVWFGVFIGGLIVVAIPLWALGERLKVARYRYFFYSGGVAQLGRREPEPRVLRWADVETVTITVKTDDGDLTTDLDTCVLSGRGTEITTEPPGDVFNEVPGFSVAMAAQQNLSPRFVAELVEACESGEAVTAGDLRVDQDGITLAAGGTRLAWSELTSVTFQHDKGEDWAPITRIDVRQGGKGWDYRVSLSGIPNGIFLAQLIARVAATHGVGVHDHQ